MAYQFKRRRMNPPTRFRFRRSRRRVMRRRRRGSKYGGTQIVRIRRSVQQSIQGTSTAGAPYTFTENRSIWSFALDQLPKAAEFTTLFKEYKIMGVKLRFHLRRGPGTAGGLTSGQYTTGVYPQLYYSSQAAGTEYSDTHYSNVSEALEDPSTKVRVLNPERPVTVWLGRPHVATNAFGGGASSSYADVASPWISTLDPSVYHYSGRFLVDSHIDSNQFIDVVSTYYLKFKGVK